MTSTSTDVATVDLDDDQWARLYRRAEQLANVSYVPAAYRKKPDDVMAAALALRALGKDLTLLTLGQLYVVNGQVDYMYQLYSALLHEQGHEIWVVDSSTESATVAGSRYGSDRVHEVTFTIEDAQRAGLVGKDNWKKYPADMLVARAGKRVAKRIAPEVVLGLPAVSHAAGQFSVTPAAEADPDTGEILDAELVDEPSSGPGGLADSFVGDGEPAPEATAGAPAAPTGGPHTSEGSPAAQDQPRGEGQPRSLAQQIAMQAQQAGLDRAHVIAAVTGGAKTSAREVDNREGMLVLRAIADLDAGFTELAEVEGVWVINEAQPPE